MQGPASWPVTARARMSQTPQGTVCSLAEGGVATPHLDPDPWPRPLMPFSEPPPQNGSLGGCTVTCSPLF